jgi:hypothetical protein
MNQQVIVAYLMLKEISACTIHKDLIVILGSDVMTYSTIVCYLHDIHTSPSSLGILSIEVQKGLDDSNQIILFTLKENPFVSVH